VPRAVVSDVARRHGLSPQQRAAGGAAPSGNDRGGSGVCAGGDPGGHRRWRSQDQQKGARRRRARQTSGIIEVEIDDVTIRVGSGADAKTFAAVIRALKAGP
jgi:transposase